jgi:hypothetical protein
MRASEHELQCTQHAQMHAQARPHRTRACMWDRWLRAEGGPSAEHTQARPVGLAQPTGGSARLRIRRTGIVGTRRREREQLERLEIVLPAAQRVPQTAQMRQG